MSIVVFPYNYNVLDISDAHYDKYLSEHNLTLYTIFSHLMNNFQPSIFKKAFDTLNISENFLFRTMMNECKISTYQY